MAKKSKIAKNEQRQRVVARYAARRAELKEIIRRPGSTEAERAAAQRELSSQPRDATATRSTGGPAVTSAPSGCPG